jgi:chemotaxis-related protein WspB
MLFLLFRLGRDRYAIEAAQIVEILPLITLKTLPGASPEIAGVIDHRGGPVPVIDLSVLALGRPAALRLSTRIIIVHYRARDGATHRLGLVAEHATETMRRETSDFVASGVSNPATPWLGPVASDPRGLIQRLDVGQLLPAAVRDLLFRPLQDTG